LNTCILAAMANALLSAAFRQLPRLSLLVHLFAEAQLGMLASASKTAVDGLFGVSAMR